jgi:hypothetical protein
MEDRMRKLTIAAALLGAVLFSGNASALTGSYADGVQAPSDTATVKVAYCYRGGCGGCCYRRVYYTGCGCGCGGGGFFGLF